MTFTATWMNLEIIIPSEVNKAEKDKYPMISLYVEFNKMIQMNLFIKQKKIHRCRKQTYGYNGGRGGDKL